MHARSHQHILLPRKIFDVQTEQQQRNDDDKTHKIMFVMWAMLLLLSCSVSVCGSLLKRLIRRHQRGPEYLYEKCFYYFWNARARPSPFQFFTLNKLAYCRDGMQKVKRVNSH